MTQKPPPIDHGYSWVIVAAATVVFLLNVGVFRSQSVFLEPVKELYGVSHGTMTLMSSFMTIVSQLITLPGNVMNEWLGPRVNVGVAGVCGILCYVFCSIAPTFPVYFVSYVFLQGAAFGLCYSPVVVTVNRYFRVYRPFASSIALSGVSFGAMIIPNVLRFLHGYFDRNLFWVLLCAGGFMACTIPIGFFLRLITHEQLALLDAQHKKTLAAEAAAEAAKDASGAEKEQELSELPSKDDNAEDTKDAPPAYTEAITPSPVVVSGNGNGESDAEKNKANELEQQEKLLAPPPAPSEQQTTPAVEVKKSNNFVAAFAYFKLMPSLLINPMFLLHVLHFAVIMSVEMLFVSVSFDSFMKDLKIQEGMVFLIRSLFGIGNFIGRFASGLVVIMPVLIAKYRKGSQPAAKSSSNASKSSCLDHVKSCITVRVVYCVASAVLCLTFVLIAVIGLGASREGPPARATTSSWDTYSTNLTTNGTLRAIATASTGPTPTNWTSVLLLIIFHVVGISAGCLFSQFPVVLAELVGLQRLGAGHALFMLVQVPCSLLHFLSGILKGVTGSWAPAYMILFIITLIITILNSVSLLFGDRIRRCLRK